MVAIRIILMISFIVVAVIGAWAILKTKKKLSANTEDKETQMPSLYEELKGQINENNKYIVDRFAKLDKSIAELRKGIEELENPTKPSKFKVGDVIGKFAISEIKTGNACDPHWCIDKNGEQFRFTEGQIKAMKKLTKK